MLRLGSALQMSIIAEWYCPENSLKGQRALADKSFPQDPNSGSAVQAQVVKMNSTWAGLRPTATVGGCFAGTQLPEIDVLIVAVSDVQGFVLPDQRGPKCQ